MSSCYGGFKYITSRHFHYFRAYIRHNISMGQTISKSKERRYGGRSIISGSNRSNVLHICRNRDIRIDEGKIYVKEKCDYMYLIWVRGQDYKCLTPLSTIFQLYHGGSFY